MKLEFCFADGCILLSRFGEGGQSFSSASVQFHITPARSMDISELHLELSAVFFSSISFFHCEFWVELLIIIELI